MGLLMLVTQDSCRVWFVIVDGFCLFYCYYCYCYYIFNYLLILIQISTYEMKRWHQWWHQITIAMEQED